MHDSTWVRLPLKILELRYWETKIAISRKDLVVLDYRTLYQVKAIWQASQWIWEPEKPEPSKKASLQAEAREWQHLPRKAKTTDWMGLWKMGEDGIPSWFSCSHSLMGTSLAPHNLLPYCFSSAIFLWRFSWELLSITLQPNDPKDPAFPLPVTVAFEKVTEKRTFLKFSHKTRPHSTTDTLERS